jgi:L-threonate 2-dehydrogenase
MAQTIAIIAPGAMGSAIARRLIDHGTQVLTSLAGRSPGTIRRAQATGMIDADDDKIAAADVILSIVPPADALALAQRFAGPLSRAKKKPVFADCNAVNVETVQQIASIITPTGAAFVDGGIIGHPPGPTADPNIYLSGDSASALTKLNDLGLHVRIMAAPVGAASALKMSYSGINKGITLLVSAMILGATRAGAADALRAELLESQASLLNRMTKSIPDMYPKAYRWGPEMEEISQFLSADPAGRHIYEGLAELCKKFAADHTGAKEEISKLNAFLKPLLKSS